MTTKKRTKIDDFEKELQSLNPELINALKNQIKEEIESDNQRLKKEIDELRAVEKRFRTQYFNKMKKSELPWFVLFAQKDETVTDGRLSYEMDWNDSFQKFLVQNKSIGTDDLDRAQNFLIELLHNIIQQKEIEKEESGGSNFQ